VSSTDLHTWATGVRQRATATLHRLQGLQGQPADAQPARAALAAQLARAGSSVERTVAVAAQAPPAGWRTRIHGQLRLHELLNVHGDAVIVDFEGDPLCPLPERQAKQSPWRDVASLLCSLSQLRLAALQRGMQAEGSLQRRHALARSWGTGLRQALLHSYTQRAAALGLPADAPGAEPLLALFELDSALQDVADALQRDDAASPSGLLALGVLADLLGAP
jgi:maltose alpha-D-glucosyltransferase/alpha-amylase